jgi:hypothetical protein
MERGNRSYENMKMRIDQGKPLNLNDQLNAISKGLLPMIGTPTTAMTKRSSKYAKGRTPTPIEFVRHFPTPSANKITESGEIINADGTRWDGVSKPHSKKTGKPIQTALADKIKRCPSPRANAGTGMCFHGEGGLDLQTAVKVSSVAESGGQLNPDWVEALMGYPQSWTDIEKESSLEADYPTAWLNGTWENDIPRITFITKDRADRLKGLGNSVVPQIPMFLWLLIAEYLSNNEGEL